MKRRHLRPLALMLCLLQVVLGTLRSQDAAGRFLVRSWHPEDGLPSSSIRSVVQSADGYLWVGTAEGIVRFDGARFRAFERERDAALAQRSIHALFPLPDGEVWAATARGGLLRWNGARFEEVWNDAAPTVPAGEIAHATQVVGDGPSRILIARGAEVWAATANGPPARIEHTPQVDAVLQADAAAWSARGRMAGNLIQLKDRRGRTWSVRAAGLIVSDGVERSEIVPLPQVEPANRISELHEDREGTIWVATGDSGLIQLRERRVEVINVADGLSDRSAMALLEDHSGAMWIGTKRGGLDRFAGGEVTRVAVGEPASTRPVSALCETRDGTLWAATRFGAVYRFRDGVFRPAFIEAPAFVKVFAIAEDRDGRVWLGGQDGVAVWENERLRQIGAERGLPPSYATAIAVDATGSIWVGTRQGQLFRGTLQGFEQMTAETSLGGRIVSSFLPEADGSLWITTLGGGLFRWADGRLARFMDDAMDPRLTCALDDAAGHLWLGSLGGIYRVRKDELIQVGQGLRERATWLQLDRSDGLLSRECTGYFQPAGWRARDGRLWFPTVNGVAHFRPDQLTFNEVVPPVVIESCRANGHLLEHPPFQAGPGRSRLDFRYSGLSFVAPEKVSFRIKLEGLDDGWRDVGPQRTAAYEAVPPGDYRFRVLAANGDGVWNETGASFAVTVVPHFWQTAWFQIAVITLAALLALIVGGTISRARIRGRVLRLEAQTARQTERARIAQDLHDDLGASLTEISLLANLAAEERTSARASEALPEIAGKAHALVTALDEIVWAVNPRHDTLVSLVDYLASYAAEFLRNAGIAFRLDAPRDLPPVLLDAERRHGLFLAVREALNNAVKHSGATEIRLRFGHRDGRIIITIEDNGRGFDAGPSTPRGEGLRGQRERLTAMGGDCLLESKPGSGTIIHFSIPTPAPS